MWPFVAGRTDGIGEANTTPPLSTWVEHGEQQHEHHGDEQPVEDEAEERQLEHVEADVGAELGVGDAERLAVAEQQPRLPLRRRRQGDEDAAEHAGADVAHAAAGGARTPRGSARRTGARWPGSALGARRSAISRLTPASGDERGEEHREQRRLGPDDAPEDVGPTEPVVPQVVDVEAGERPTEHDDDEEQHADDDEDRPARDPPSRASPGKVGGAPHGREATGRRDQEAAAPGVGRRRTCARSGTARRPGSTHRRGRCPRSRATAGPSGSTIQRTRRAPGEARRTPRGRRRGGTRRRAARRCAASSTRGRRRGPRLATASLSPSPSSTLRSSRSRSGVTRSAASGVAHGRQRTGRAEVDGVRRRRR